jgi:hypothetical protein
MRRICAILLLVPLTALFLEWVRVPSICEGSVAGVCRVKHESKDCCHHKDAQKRGCETTCIDCPLCYLVTFQPFCRFEYLSTPVRIDYTMLRVDRLPEYFRQPWKPPNVPFSI